MQKSLLSRGSELSNSSRQLKVLDASKSKIPFEDKLDALGLLPFKSTGIDVLQVNLGKMCNQVCEHCHVDAGPDRKEIMTKETMQDCLEAVRKSSISTVDLTGGAPEMNPDFLWFVEELTELNVEVIVRSNLTILTSNKKYREYPDFFKKHRVTVISSLPCYTESNTDSQRGEGVFSKSIEALKVLNSLGYGVEASGLQLHLVYNPGGASLPPAQDKLEDDYKRVLMSDFGISFNSLYTITNLPISRYLDYLLISEKYDQYMDLLIESFNPSAAFGVMCRNTLSVGWDGKLFDCDFNQMLDLEIKSNNHIKDFNRSDLETREIVVNQHCYGCTAGAGSSCQGSLVS